ncbi:MAG: hypothetical protein KKE35_04175 [Actinobacteria bacterium]|nr:hypothetical protein [Actinomycetota bacterium]
MLKKRLLDEGNKTVTNCNALKMADPELAIDRAQGDIHQKRLFERVG